MNIEQEKMIVESLPSLYPMMQKFEEEAIWAVLDALKIAEPRTGKWEPQSGGGYCCSVCGRYAMDKADGRIVMISVKSKFCPNCGAKMDGKDGAENV